jgi:hypothetical protein
MFGSEAVMKRLCRWRKSDQVPTCATTIEEIMDSHAFALGVADARAGLSMHSEYDKWNTNAQWNYERGRCWARVAPGHIALKRGGKVTREALRYYSRDII